jgi:hypothetical protein
LRRASYGEATSNYTAATAAAERAVALAHDAGEVESEAAGHLLWALARRRLSDYPRRAQAVAAGSGSRKRGQHRAAGRSDS